MTIENHVKLTTSTYALRHSNLNLYQTNHIVSNIINKNYFERMILNDL